MHQQPTARQLIRAAVAAAGGTSTAGPAMGITSQAVSGWIERGQVPAKRLAPLCDLGGRAIQPEQILAAMAREHEAQKAAA